MSYETIILEKKERIATITFNRPKFFNAYSEKMTHELKAAVNDVAKADSVRILVLKGAGDNFLAGADITMLNSWTKIATEQGWEKVKEILDDHFSPTMLEKLPKPVIAAIDGRAWGMGSEIAIACDIRVCTTRASFAQPEITLGIITGGGASQRLPRLVGKAKAMEMILTGIPINAEEAYKWGLVNKVVAPEGLDAAVMQIANSILVKGSEVVKYSKQCVNLVLNHDLYSGIQKELMYFAKVFAMPDAKEGTTAFLEKRKPNFM
jgi:enoyl-CoA hydratase